MPDISPEQLARRMAEDTRIAILNEKLEQARIRDPRVRRLADGILEAQVREIGEMKSLIADLEQHPANGAYLPPKQVGQ